MGTLFAGVQRIVGKQNTDGCATLKGKKQGHLPEYKTSRQDTTRKALFVPIF